MIRAQLEGQLALIASFLEIQSESLQSEMKTEVLVRVGGCRKVGKLSSTQFKTLVGDGRDGGW